MDLEWDSLDLACSRVLASLTQPVSLYQVSRDLVDQSARYIVLCGGWLQNALDVHLPDRCMSIIRVQRDRVLMLFYHSRICAFLIRALKWDSSYCALSVPLARIVSCGYSMRILFLISLWTMTIISRDLKIPHSASAILCLVSLANYDDRSLLACWIKCCSRMRAPLSSPTLGLASWVQFLVS